jgi:uncharacterized DUF497 family protein
VPRFTWNAAKARSNLLKHGVAFEDAELVWRDPRHLLRFDRIEDGEERWHAIGLAGSVVVLLVAHTDTEDGDIIRLLSARRATKAERKAYENDDV